MVLEVVALYQLIDLPLQGRQHTYDTNDIAEQDIFLIGRIYSLRSKDPRQTSNALRRNKEPSS